MDKISIIIPAYNAAKTIRRSYDSILKQTYKNFEVITVNDASNDDTLCIMKEYSEKDKRFVAIDNPHGGVSKARNTGLKKATGDFIAFMDADDDINERYLEKLLELIKRNNADLAICRFTHPFFQTFCENKVFDMTKETDFLEVFEDTFALTIPWNKLWKRECVLELFDENERFGEDELFNMANIVNTKRVVTTNEYLYNYYVAPPSENTSAINNIVKTNDFWNKKASIYFLGTKLVQKRLDIANRAIQKKLIPLGKPEEIGFIRAIDFYFGELSIYFGTNVPEDGIITETMNVFRDEYFQKGFMSKKRFGIELKKLDDVQLESFARKYIRLCKNIYEQNSSNKNFKMQLCFTSLFLLMFTNTTGRLNLASIYARLLMDLQTNTSIEARCIKEIFNNDTLHDDNFNFAYSNNLVKRPLI